MPQEFISEYGLDPVDYVEQLTNQFRARCQKFSEPNVEEAIFVDGGPIDYLVWVALDNYETHTFFYQDTDPDLKVLQRFIFLSPNQQEMSDFKSLLKTYYDVYRELDLIRVLELRDTYLPQVGERPRATFGVWHEPSDDQIVSGISGTPRPQEQKIFEHIDKIVPDKNIEKFVSRTVQSVHAQIEEKAERHTITADIREQLDQDPDFKYETTKPLPKGINPKYTDMEAELWQKPASRVKYMDGSQGFLQVWIPIDEENVTLVNATAGAYDREAIVDSIRKEFETGVA